MASQCQIQKPYVLTQLPKPLIQSGGDGGYHVGEVFGQRPGSRKRKRSEVVVGIDGEALNVYDVPSSRLVTSYPIPPHAQFTCAPASLRWRSSPKNFARYTYAASSNRPQSYRISLFKDGLEAGGKTTSTTISRDFKASDPPAFISPSSQAQPPRSEVNSNGDGGSPSLGIPDLIAVSGAGHITCFNGETLEQHWVANPDILAQNIRIVGRDKPVLKVELVALAPSSLVIPGIFGGKQDAYSVFSKNVDPDTFDPDTLIIVTTVTNSSAPLSHIHVLAISPTSKEHQQHVFCLRSAPLILPSEETSSSLTSYQVDVRSGALLRLTGQVLCIFDLRDGIPKLRSETGAPGATSLLRLSDTSILILSPDAFAIYNPIYQTLQAKTPLEAPANPVKMPTLVSYFAREEMAVALIDGSLVAAQVEAPQTRASKRRSVAQFIDTVGQGLQERIPISKKPRPRLALDMVPGTLMSGYWDKLEQEQAKADACLRQDNIAGFEVILANNFSIPVIPSGGGKDSSIPRWEWPATRGKYPTVDVRWVQYAISRIFNWAEMTVNDLPATKLKCTCPFGNVVSYLGDAGHLGMKNIRDAFKDEPLLKPMSDHDVAVALVDELIVLDASLESLVNYLAATRLGAFELLAVLRAMMVHLEGSDTGSAPLRLLLGEDPEGGEDGEGEEGKEARKKEDGLKDEEGDVAMKDEGVTAQEEDEVAAEIDVLEAELERGEEGLRADEMGIRAMGLSLVLSKLYRYDSQPTIQALRAAFKPQQIMALVMLLRTELVRGGWTSLYMDMPQMDMESDDYTPPPDNSIKIISELLSRCVDALGQGGWLAGDTELGAEGEADGGFVNELKLEISVALEGTESASYLQGLVSNVVHYSDRLRMEEHKSNNVVIQGKDSKARDASQLPLGLKTKADEIDKEKTVASTGEVVIRSKREMGHLISQKVGMYSVERIVVPL